MVGCELQHLPSKLVTKLLMLIKDAHGVPTPQTDDVNEQHQQRCAAKSFFFWRFAYTEVNELGL